LWGSEVTISCFILTKTEKFCISIFSLLGTLIIVKRIPVVLHQNSWNTICDKHVLFSKGVSGLFSIFLFFIKRMLANSIA